jgi:hypothetical protein
VSDFLHGLLVGLFFAAGLPIGGAILEAIHLIVRGRWGAVLHPALRASTPAPWLAIGFVAVALGLGRIYPWATDWRSDAWLAPVPFLARSVVALAALAAFAELLWRASERDEPPAWVPPVALMGTTVVACFLSWDWGMALEPEHVSGVYAFLAIVGWMITAFSVALLVALVRRPAPSEEVRSDFGSLLLTLAVVWSYLRYVELVIVWSADLPKEIPWWLARTEGSWRFVAMAIAALHLFLPLSVLIFHRLKLWRLSLFATTAAILGVRLLDTIWTLAPAWPQPLGLTGALGIAVPIVAAAALFVRHLRPELPPASRHILDEIAAPAWAEAS